MSIVRIARILAVAAVLAVAATSALAQVKVGSKNFTEQFIVAEIYAQALEAAGIKVERKINLGGTLEFRERVFVGDRLGSRKQLVDVYIKRIKIDPEAFWIVTDTIYVNQDERIVAVNRNTLIRHRSRELIAATTPEQLALLPAQ